ncbi:MAG TPA: hypothetical protein IAA94_08500 [Candidatus Galloscillospira stercoripullorum]|nr:hypothetical protein [Candidatus Galloscillospira stercoripullorum]
MDKPYLDVIMNILANVKPGKIDVSENLFGSKNNFTPRDMAYVLLEMERLLGINIEKLVHFVENDQNGFTVAILVDAVMAQNCGI